MMYNLTVAERNAIIQQIEQALQQKEISLGQAIKRIRTELYGMNQSEYAKFIDISDKTLREIEKGRTDPRLSIITKLLAPGGFQLSARAVKRTI